MMSDPQKMLEEETRNHQTTVLRDDGLYRHIRFKEPGTSIWHFDLITWPGHLVITGDLEDYHFARIPDMFEFFRRTDGGINPGYWSQKLRGPVKFKSYSQSRLRQLVFLRFREACIQLPGPHRPLWRAICKHVLAEDVTYDETAAHEALDNFSFELPPEPRTWTAEAPMIYGREAQDFQPQFIPRPRYHRGRGKAWRFVDTWEWDLTSYDHQFLLALHAIVWGIRQYDNAQKSL